MACRYTYNGATYSAAEFMRVLSALPPMEAAKFMPGVNPIPNAPFVNSGSWPMIAMKRVLRMAVDGGYDAVAWTTGDIQAERYDLSKHVDAIVYVRNDDGTFDLEVSREGRIFSAKTDATQAQLADFVGKDVAGRIVNGDGDKMGGDARDGTMRLSGDNLKVGGEGMRAFYDRMLPN